VVEAVEGCVKPALAEGKDAPVGPGSGFAGREAGGVGEARLGTDVIADLEGGEAGVEGVGELEVGLRVGLWDEVFGAAAGEERGGDEEGRGDGAKS